MRYLVWMEHAPNADIGGGGYWEPPVSPERTVADADTLAEASRKFTQWIGRNGLGGGNITTNSGVVFERATGEPVARVSYNGRVWTPEGWGLLQRPTEIDVEKFDRERDHDDGAGHGMSDETETCPICQARRAEEFDSEFVEEGDDPEPLRPIEDARERTVAEEVREYCLGLFA